jgi:hypothetical protein
MLQRKIELAFPDQDFVVFRDNPEEKEEASQNNELSHDIKPILNASAWNERWLNGIYLQLRIFYF